MHGEVDVMPCTAPVEREADRGVGGGINEEENEQKREPRKMVHRTTRIVDRPKRESRLGCIKMESSRFSATRASCHQVYDVTPDRWIWHVP